MPSAPAPLEFLPMAKTAKSAQSAARLRKRLERVPMDVRAAAATEALLQAQALGRAIQRNAPLGEGDLKATVRVEGGKRGDRFYVKAGGPKTTKPVRSAGKGHAPQYDYANAVEFGTQKKPPRPFFYPTWRASKKAIRSGMEATIRKAAAKFNGQGSE
jgi:HK97 gp10 family phage protein